MIRAFVACQLPMETVEGLRGYQHRLEDALANEEVQLSWASPTSFHLTLRFLGEIEESLVSALADSLRYSLATLRPFSFKIQGLGCFPRAGSARILWSDVEGSQLLALYEAVETGLDRIGLPREQRPFHPHVTLGRLHSPGDLSQFLQYAPTYRSNSLRVSEVTLYSSQLSPTGAIHQVLRRVPLTGKAHKES